MKIVAGYDGSNLAKEALNLAKEHARAFGAEVDILTSLTQNVQITDIQKAENELENQKTFFEADKISCETHVIVSSLSPGEDLVQFVKDNQVDEIIVGIKRRSKVGKLVFGSTAQYIILYAECPVVAIK